MSRRSPLIRPREYFDDHPDPLIPGLLVFGIYLLVSVVVMYLTYRFVIANTVGLTPEGFDTLHRSLWMTVLSGVVRSIVALLIVAAVMHYSLNVLFIGEFGSYERALAVATWSYAPDLILSIVEAAFGAYVIRGRTFDASDPEVFAEQLLSVLTGVGEAVIIVQFVAIAWSVYILAIGISETHDADVRRTVAPAVLIGIVSFVLVLASVASTL